MKKFLIIISCVVVILAAIFIKFMYGLVNGNDNIMLIIETRNRGFRSIDDKNSWEGYVLKVYYDGLVKKS